MTIKDTLRAMELADGTKFEAAREEMALDTDVRETDAMFEYQRSFVMENINEA